jgi:hypothetical protein
MVTMIDIGTHHSGPTSPTDPYSSSVNLTEAQINSAHMNRQFNKSSLGWYVGYNIVIYRDGSWKQYRLIGEQTAAATGKNFDTCHIMLIGNFTPGVDSPTLPQITTLRLLMGALMDNDPKRVGMRVKDGTKLSFTPFRVNPHRVLQPNHTSCHGNLLDNNFGREIAFTYIKDKYKSDPVLYRAMSLIASYFKSTFLKSQKLGSINDDKGYCNFNYNL